MDFHPAVREWFHRRLGEPTEPQRLGWPPIQRGESVLIAAPTGTGKTLTAFLSVLSDLMSRGDELPDATQVLYVSPLRALSHDVQKNLQVPLDEIRAAHPALAELRVLVRTGDTTASQRAAMVKKSPHILVTTPESLGILLTSASGRAMLGSIRCVIVDEIHALAGNRRGAHLALLLERLEALAGPVQRIGLSATQKPLDEIGRFLVGVGRECTIVDAGHLREIDLGIELPDAPLETVCSHETWALMYQRMVALIEEHRSTLVFVNTRKLAERISAQLSDRLGADHVTCHHSSLSKDRRLDAEQRLKAGQLRALVATASLELGLDIGDVDLVIQVGVTASIATFLQRVGRSGHVVHRVPRGRIFPLTPDELVQATALVQAVTARHLDRIVPPQQPLDILAQQIVSECAAREWREDELFACFLRAWPYRNLTREWFDRCVALHTEGRRALLHRDGVGGRLLGTKRARLPAITSGGAIGDNADYRVVKEPEATFVGTLNEDFAIEASAGDVFQLGNTSWQILRVASGTVHVVDAAGVPPTLPFWFGEAPARTDELSAEITRVREAACEGSWPGQKEITAAIQREVEEYVRSGANALGTLPTRTRLVAERFFDESGGMQLVLHAPLGNRINRALGLALRKRFCRGFGFELQAAASEDAILLSLGPMHSFPLEEVFDYLHPGTVRDLLIQAMLPTPMFSARWRWNTSRSLQNPRMQGGKKVPPPLLRMRADDLLATAFPGAAACPETLDGPDVEIPADHPIVHQTLEDCLHEAMDIDGLIAVLEGLRSGAVERVAVDTAEPSPFARAILSAQPYSFLDDAPLEERRTQAVLGRRGLSKDAAEGIGALDPAAVERVQDEAWPAPASAEEVHEVLLWMGFVSSAEAAEWLPWLRELQQAGRVQQEGVRWFATEASRDPLEVLRGRMEALGPVASEDPLLYQLEAEGAVLRTRLQGREMWCDRRLLARIQRYTLDRLRQEIQPVSAAEFLRFLARWQHACPEDNVEGPGGLQQVLRCLAGFEAAAFAWERDILPRRVRGYRRDWLDRLILSGELVWGRFFGAGKSPIRSTPLTFVPREDLPRWIALGAADGEPILGSHATVILESLQAAGAMFPIELHEQTRLLPVQLEEGLAELIGQGLITCDSFVPLRQLFIPASRRKMPVEGGGRWSLLRRRTAGEVDVEFVARQYLRRTGVIFRKMLARERLPVPWRDLLRVYRTLELRGEVRGGRFVDGFAGEQYALPEAIQRLRRTRREGPGDAERDVTVSAADPLNYSGVLTPEVRIPARPRTRVTLA